MPTVQPRNVLPLFVNKPQTHLAKASLFNFVTVKIVFPIKGGEMEPATEAHHCFLGHGMLKTERTAFVSSVPFLRGSGSTSLLLCVCCRQIAFGGTCTRKEKLKGKAVTSRFFFLLSHTKCYNHNASFTAGVPSNCGVVQGCCNRGPSWKHAETNKVKGHTMPEK